MSLPLPAIVRLENAAKTTIYHWCEEIGRIVDEYGIKELQSVLPVITDSLFELHVHHLGWSLRTLTRENNPRDFQMIASLLSPRGPIINLCYKLLSDSTIKYEFPLSYIPIATRHLLEEGVLPAFYVGKLQYHAQLRVPSSLVLNSFEYFMMHFFYYLVNPNLHKYNTISSGSDSVYFAIVEEYLQYFLPCNGSSHPDLVPVPSPGPSSNPFGPSVYVTTPTKSDKNWPTRQQTPSLLKKSCLTPNSSNSSGGTGSSTNSLERTTNHDSWRTMMILQAIIELWMSHVTLNKDNSNLQAAGIGSPTCRNNSQQLHVLQPVVFLPSMDHLRAIRILTKHLHYFANSIGPNIISSLDELKRTVWTNFQKKLYVFLRHTLEHWPLDASFRLFLETWLSYIQPWRYIFNANRISSTSGGDTERIVDWKWQPFVAENLLFYTLFLQKVVARFLRVELSSPKNALMLYRISKVYSQRNVKEMIAVAESSSKSGSLSPIAASVRQCINDLENPSFNYSSLFGQETALQIRMILASAARVKSGLRHSLLPVSTGKKRRNVLAVISDWLLLTGSASAGCDDNIEETKRTLNHLEQSSAQLSCLFDVENPSEPEEFHPDLTPVRGANESMTMDAFNLTMMSPPPAKRYDLVYGGNPDTQPIRSYEIAFLVRLFHQFCTNINERFGEDLEQSSERQDFVGRVIRQLLAPPASYQEIVKRSGTPRVVTKRLGHRLCLRRLASQQVVAYTLAVWLVSYTFGWAPEILLLLAVCCICAFVFVRASLDTWRASGGFVSIPDDSFVD